MVNKNLKHNIDWKKTWNRMRAERMRPLKIEDAPLFKEKLFEDYLKNAKSNNYEYGRNIVNSLNNVLSENFKVLEIGPGPGTLTIPLARKVKKMLAIESSKRAASYLIKDIEEKQIKNVEVINKDWEKVDDKNIKDSFDLVICSQFLWQIKDIEKHLERMENASNKYCAVIQPAGRDNLVKEIWIKVTGKDYTGQFEPDADYFAYLILRSCERLINVRIIRYSIERDLEQMTGYVASFIGKFIEVDSNIKKIIERCIANRLKDGMYKESSSAVVMWWKCLKSLENS